MSDIKGYIYIASAFHTVNRSKCGQGGTWVDNDPHFWTEPPTWGICRNDLRKRAEIDNYIFFVLPRHGRHPQMVFGWLRIAEKISHLDAYHRPDLLTKRMGNKNPNGNIIVDAHGNYNPFDCGVHKDKFQKIKNDYVVGDPLNSRMFNDLEIRALAPTFIPTLNSIFGKSGQRAIDIVSKYGQKLNEQQVKSLLQWLTSGIDSST
jgi:hypothetical protein